ncbi:MAG: WG repeat-containing protein [Candidatus Ornithomonoglobus sp.]
MKKIQIFIMSIIMLYSGAAYAYDEDGILPSDAFAYLSLNNYTINTTRLLIYEIDGIKYFPIRKIVEALGMSISWDDQNQVITINRDALLPFRDDEVKLFGYKDVYGNVIIEPVYYGADPFYQGRAVVDTIGIYHSAYINKEGKIISPVYVMASSYSEGLAYVSKDSAQEVFTTDHDIPVQFIDLDGNVAFDKEFYYGFLGNFHNGYAAVLKSGTTFDIFIPPEKFVPRKWGFIDKTGEFVNDMEFEETTDFDDGFACVQNGGKWGVIDTDFNLVLDYQYDDYKDARANLNKFKPEYVDFKFEIDGGIINLQNNIVVLNDKTYLSSNDIGLLLNMETDETYRGISLTSR